MEGDEGIKEYLPIDGPGNDTTGVGVALRFDCGGYYA